MSSKILVDEITPKSASGDITIKDSSGTTNMVIRDDGIITNPYVPAFHVTYADGVTCTASGTNYAFTSPSISNGFNNGNHYDVTNNYFLVPVSGIYLFYFSYLRANNQLVFRAIVVNADTNSRYNQSPQLRSSEGWSGYNLSASQTSLFNCTAGDKLRLAISCDSAGGVIYDDNNSGNYNYFGGYLVG